MAFLKSGNILYNHRMLTMEENFRNNQSDFPLCKRINWSTESLSAAMKPLDFVCQCPFFVILLFFFATQDMVGTLFNSVY